MQTQGRPVDLRELLAQESGEDQGESADRPDIGTIWHRMFTMPLRLSPSPSSDGAILVMQPEASDEVLQVYMDLLASARAVISNPSSMTTELSANLIFFYEHNPGLWEPWQQMADCKPACVTVSEIEDFPLEAFGPICSGLSDGNDNDLLVFAVPTALAYTGQYAEAVRAWQIPVDATRHLLKNANEESDFNFAADTWSFAQIVCRRFINSNKMEPILLREMFDALDGGFAIEGLRRTATTKAYKELYALEYICMNRSNVLGETLSENVLAELGTFIPVFAGVSNEDIASRAGQSVGSSVASIAKPYFRWEIAEVSEIQMQWLDLLALNPWDWEQAGIVFRDNLNIDDLEPHNLTLFNMSSAFADDISRDSKRKCEKTLSFVEQLGTLRIDLACEIFRLENGAHPGSLDDLVPGLFETVPVNPRTGLTFEYSPDLSVGIP